MPAPTELGFEITELISIWHVVVLRLVAVLDRRSHSALKLAAVTLSLRSTVLASDANPEVQIIARPCCSH